MAYVIGFVFAFLFLSIICFLSALSAFFRQWTFIAIIVGLVFYLYRFYLDYHFLDFTPDLVRGKRVLITGASRGMGRNVALHYARFGAVVVITARDEEALRRVKEECEALAQEVGTECSVNYIVGEQGSPKDAQELVDAAAELLGGGIDILFLNHGISEQSNWNGTSAQYKKAFKAMEVNFLSQVYLASAARRFLDAGNGSIVVVNSASARSPMPTFSYYGASKAAMTTFFRSLDLEYQLSDTNITVTICTMGLVKTERNIQKETSSLAYKLGAEPEDAALFMIKSAALKLQEVKYPIVQFLIKDLIDYLPHKLKLIALRRVMPKSHDS